MARVWDEHTTAKLIEEKLAKVAPGNTAPIPISAHKEESETRPGQFIWVVSLLVRIPRVTEYDVEGFGDTLGEAMRRAYLGLNNEARTRRQADIANAQFGVIV